MTELINVNDFKDEYDGNWVGVDLDGTLAVYDGFKGPDIIGAPIPEMVDRVKGWISEGRMVKIFTARVSPNTPPGKEDHPERARKAILEWTLKHIGLALEVTHEKDYMMRELWDDRAVQVKFNGGIPMVETMKCCANCTFSIASNWHDDCENQVGKHPANHVCEHWSLAPTRNRGLK